MSRQHFNVRYENGEYFINDHASANGTNINGIDIKGKGWQELKDGDRIDVSGIVTLTYKI
jgi:pSer/pThr/pTyr-binding forkhead associated (FHA) protein